MTLTKDDIQFIDNYLSSKIEHIDIRMEMVDHVAESIEVKMNNGDDRDFYYIFKDYMVENKRKLLDNNKQFLKIATKKLSKEILKLFVSPSHIILMLSISLLFYNCFQFFEFSYAKNIAFLVTLILIITPAIVYGYMLKFYKYERFSSAERINFFLIILVQFINLINISNSNLLAEKPHILLMSIMIGLIFNFVLSLSRVSITVFRDCKTKYQAIL